MHDYSGTELAPKNEIATRMFALVRLLREAQAEEANYEAQLKDAAARVKSLEEVLIPEAMKDLGTTIYRLPQDGTTITLVDEVRASITNENKERAYDWLEENGHGGLVKRTIVVMFNRDQEEAAKKLREQLAKEYAGVKQDVTIHASTLTAWAKRRREAGETFPDCISVHAPKVAKLKAKET